MSGISSGVIATIITVILLAVLAFVTEFISFKWNNLKYSNYSRVLNTEETTWLSANSIRLSEEKSGQKYPSWTLLLWGGLLPVLLGMGIVGGIVILTHHALLRPVDLSAFAWQRLPIGVSTVLAIFLGILMAAIAMIFLSRLSKTLRDYLTYKYGWGYMTPKSRGEQDIREELEHQLRKQTLTVQDAYDSNHFSNLIFNRTSPVWKRGSLALFCLTALFLAFDVRYEIDLSEEKISYSPYFSLATKNYRYEDVTHITRECTLGVSDDREHPYLSYSLHLPDARKVLLFSLQGKGETPHLDAIEKIIPKLQNVKFEPTKVDTAPALRLDPTEAECIRLIHQVHDTKTSKRIISLFDLVS